MSKSMAKDRAMLDARFLATFLFSSSAVNLIQVAPLWENNAKWQLLRVDASEVTLSVSILISKISLTIGQTSAGQHCVECNADRW